MKTSSDTFWEMALDANEPTRDELARAEADLQATPVAEPLLAHEVAAWIAGAIQPRQEVALLAAPRRSRQNLFAACAALLVCLSSIASVAVDNWPALHRVTPNTLTYSGAIAGSTEIARDEESRRAALTVIVDPVGYLSRTLHKLSSDENAQVASSARAALERLARLVQSDSTRGPLPVSDTLLDEGMTALDQKRTPTERVQAITQIERLATEGALAILHFRMTSPDGIIQAGGAVRELQKNMFPPPTDAHASEQAR